MIQRLLILLVLICTGCSNKDSLPEQYQVYKWRAISFSNEVEGEYDITLVADTLFANKPVNIDSTNQRFELYKLPSQLKTIEKTDTVLTSNGIEFIVYSNMFSEFWYHQLYGIVWTVYPHAKSKPFVWSYELDEVIEFQNGTEKVFNTDSLIASIQSYRYQRLQELEKELEN